MLKMRRFIKQSQGASLVEFALASLAFLTIMFGIIEMGNIYWQQSTLDYAVAAAARYAYVHPTATVAQIETYANSTVPSNISISYTITITAQSKATITGKLTYKFIALIFLGTMTLTSTVVQPLVP